MSQRGVPSSQSGEETSDDGKESTGNGTSVDRQISGTPVNDVVGNATSLGGVAGEGSTASLLYGIVKVGLVTRERAVLNAGSIGDAQAGHIS